MLGDRRNKPITDGACGTTAHMAKIEHMGGYETMKHKFGDIQVMFLGGDYLGFSYNIGCNL